MAMVRNLLLLLCLLLVISCSFSTAGGSTDTGQTFTVVAINPDGKPVQNAHITLFHEEYETIIPLRSTQLNGKTDSNGEYTFTGISSGSYNLKIIDSVEDNILFTPNIKINTENKYFKDTLKEPVLMTYANKDLKNGSLYIPGSDIVYQFATTDSIVQIPLPQGVYDLHMFSNGVDTTVADSLVVSEESKTDIGNRAPVISVSPEDAKTTIYTRETYRTKIAATDPDKDSFVFSLKQNYPGVQLTSKGILEYNPTVNDTGTLSVTIYCTDSYYAQDSIVWHFTVLEVTENIKPKFIMLPEELYTTAQSGTSYSVQLKAVDANDDLLKYLLIKSPTKMEIKKETGLVSWDLKDIPADEYPVSVYVHDVLGLSDTISWTVTVK